jgi:hypothetical protein
MFKVWESLNNESNFKAHLSIFLEFAKGSNENDIQGTAKHISKVWE